VADAGEVPYWVAILTGLGGAGVTGLGAIIVARVTRKGTTTAATTTADATVLAAKETAERTLENADAQRTHELIIEGMKLARDEEHPVAVKQGYIVLDGLSKKPGLPGDQAMMIGALASLAGGDELTEGRDAAEAGEDVVFYVDENDIEDDDDTEEV
jgi:hypothetical protein